MLEIFLITDSIAYRILKTKSAGSCNTNAIHNFDVSARLFHSSARCQIVNVILCTVHFIATQREWVKSLIEEVFSYFCSCQQAAVADTFYYYILAAAYLASFFGISHSPVLRLIRISLELWNTLIETLSCKGSVKKLGNFIQFVIIAQTKTITEYQLDFFLPPNWKFWTFSYDKPRTSCVEWSLW